VPSIVARNQSIYSTKNISFIQLDASAGSLPSADLLICKDVLQHLPNAHVQQILNQAKKFKYCLFVNDINYIYMSNQDIEVGGYRPLDLTQAPFYLFPTDLYYYFSVFNFKCIFLIENPYETIK
jgi:hypothetical protein